MSPAQPLSIVYACWQPSVLLFGLSQLEQELSPLLHDLHAEQALIFIVLLTDGVESVDLGGVDLLV